ncbi:MAG: nickel pincer cofactor biosynthesis protein LarC [Butyricicoccus sp.]|nr:nickel pincer cofactor biosynthesis protein LarC [Butyricicoccus sp.]
MKILYLDCGMGAAGDMLSAALLELLPEAEAADFLKEANALGIPGVRVERQKSVKCGITGTHLAVTVDGLEELGHGRHGHEHRHGSMHGIEHAVREHLALPESVKDDLLAVYGLIAEAESRVHGVPVTDIHFHEVGTLDALADIAMFCLLMCRIAPDEVVASPVRLGFGQVRCAHGVLPVPAPATAELLRGVPVYAGDIRGEMCTPTGAALLRHFAARFGEMPLMRVSAVGYGCGTKDLECANCLRAMLGEAESGGDGIIELACNVDDMTAEEVGFAMERLFAAGALDVYTAAVGMKKSRPGTLIRVICAPERRDALCRELFRHTTTLGVRECAMRRHVLERGIVTLDTPAGPVRRKDSQGFGVARRKYEFDDLAAIARERGISLREAAALVEKSGE